VILVAEAAQDRQKIPGRDIDATAGLNGFDENGTDFLVVKQVTDFRRRFLQLSRRGWETLSGAE